MKLSKEQIKEFEDNKAGLEERIANGFEWPVRTGFFAQFRALEKEIGSAAMDDTEKAAYLSYACRPCGHNKFKTYFWDRSAQTPNGAQKEIEHFEACKRKLVDFDNWQTFKKIESQAKKANEQLQAIYNSLKAACSNLQLPQLSTINNQFEIALHQIKSIERDANIAKTLNTNHAENMQAHKHTHSKVESVPIIVHENQTEEGNAVLQSRGMLVGIKATNEETEVYGAYFNDGRNARSQKEVSQITKLSINQVRRRAVSLNEKAGKELIIWNRTPKRGKGYETDLEQNRKWTVNERRKHHETE